MSSVGNAQKTDIFRVFRLFVMIRHNSEPLSKK